MPGSFKWVSRHTASLWVLAFATLCIVVATAKPKKEKLSNKSAAVAEGTEFRGLCDASAAVPISTNLVVVASDEENILRVYDRDRGGMPVRSFSDG